jgi:hypothetical protein
LPLRGAAGGGAERKPEQANQSKGMRHGVSLAGPGSGTVAESDQVG